MATKLLYLEDFDVLTCTATVVEVFVRDSKMVIVLDQTCFYPRGGGQDWDTGRITTPSAEFKVEEVRLDESGTVQHSGEFVRGVFTVDDYIACTVDKQRRKDNTRLHSAGHLLDMAVESLALPWIPGKGAHYPHMSFVEYASQQPVDDAIQVKLQEKIDQLQLNNYENKILFMPVGQMHEYCRHVPENIPANKPARIVLYNDTFGIPCGGTHVRSVSGIGKVFIRKIKAKKGTIKVSYSVNGIN